MRDKRFIAEHRGGLLRKEEHRQFIRWACLCAEHVLPLLSEKMHERLNEALLMAKEWESGKATTGQARKAAVKTIKVANMSFNPIEIAVARAAGHAVATAHMADHSLGAALYALKAVEMAGKSIDEERKWQNEQLPSAIREFVVTERSKKENALKIRGDSSIKRTIY